ncbi:MAG: 16S rRNA (adenine(1518)-N(6)/adenine(1519)-N(6))-dimethyltransferase RsmA [Bacteroidota bacterium]|nr:16S rRNA (adenine(1518)-N(6)/adenine(1519)-N(6))-dimethyltransferase RsmA [Bacteroidota bacterium]MDP4232551.1 16S rRNA (adenine(1518)-N(6)/adenine(1519)-N(6))-dimethyltransferase RsmA [Bacteroidota bacterium]MDP4242994.1 16S rRNA (adenine(1518)-N(6)/adenine(1519)-N(6))-dimethyltransferase RsmA [Bacteroidota bacterium]MDP4286431.1 16S rRNA (adenine(1518)-N(6)/adenine(1519)-N(6))-dimethyltransferase RsmA [Bacteroidota bacterium]
MIPLQARKSLGQHFLIDSKAHERIVRAVAPVERDVVVEIGPGTGLLTKHLLATPLRHLIAFELDARVIPGLRSDFESFGDRFEVIEGDFLQADLSALAERFSSDLRVTGNIPYYITSPILFKLIDARECVRDATLLLQREVAERLVAKPSTKAYGIPTVLANFFGSVKLLFHVPAGAFRPVPKVDSAVVQLDFRLDYFARSGTERPANFDAARFRTLVRTLFGMRRKTIRNNLKGLVSPVTLLELESSDEKRFLDLRAEALDLCDFLALYRAVGAFSVRTPFDPTE